MGVCLRQRVLGLPGSIWPRVELRRHLLHMDVRYWSRGSHYISKTERTGDNEGLGFLRLYLGLSLLLMYLAAQLIQI